MPSKGQCTQRKSKEDCLFGHAPDDAGIRDEMRDAIGKKCHTGHLVVYVYVYVNVATAKAEERGQKAEGREQRAESRGEKRKVPLSDLG
jgi:hypothetical protein